MQQVLLKHTRPEHTIQLDEYKELGGYQSLNKVLNLKSPQEVIQILNAANLKGRGGAAFPMGQKLLTLPVDLSKPRYVVCNADEMEPGTFKDRNLIERNPHQLIEGMIITGFASRANQGIIFIRPEYEAGAQILEEEIKKVEQEGWLGNNINDSDFSYHIEVHRSGGRYICGEATALLNALEGKRPNPRKQPPFPTLEGLWKSPTDVQNVETLCCVPHILNYGAEWFHSLGMADGASGTKLFSVSGKVNKPGCYELPLGIRLSDIIENHAGGMKDGAAFKACLPGGASTRYIPDSLYDIEMDFTSMQKQGYRLGTAAMMIFDENTCLVEATINLTNFFARESCGWCTPCREGLPYIRDLLTRIENGEGKPEYYDKLVQMVDHLNYAFCAFAPGAGAPVESLLTVFKDEVMAHIEGGKCPFK